MQHVVMPEMFSKFKQLTLLAITKYVLIVFLFSRNEFFLTVPVQQVRFTLFDINLCKIYAQHLSLFVFLLFIFLAAEFYDECGFTSQQLISKRIAQWNRTNQKNEYCSYTENSKKIKIKANTNQSSAKDWNISLKRIFGLCLCSFFLNTPPFLLAKSTSQTFEYGDNKKSSHAQIIAVCGEARARTWNLAITFSHFFCIFSFFFFLDFK